MPRYFGEPNPLDDPVECAVGFGKALIGCFALLLGLIILMAVAIVILLAVVVVK